MNVILIISDTFRYDCATGGFVVRDKRAEVRDLERLRSRGTSFLRAYTGSFPTVPNRHDILTGRYTFTYSDWQPLPPNEAVLPEILRESGYASAMIADTPHILKDGFHYDRGFDAWQWIRGQENDRYRSDPLEIELPCKPEKLRSVQTTIQHMRNNASRALEEDWIPARTAVAAIDWLKGNSRRRPFFLYIDFFDPHEPWDPPRGYIDLYDAGYAGEEVTYPVYGPCDYLTRDELEHCRAMYAGEATLVDKWIGRVLQAVDSLGLHEDTAIIFTSDHGFYLGEHGLIGKSIIIQDFYGSAPLYEEVAHIPLFVKLPDGLGRRGRSEVNELAQPPDITATILDLAGMDWRKYGTQGKSLMPCIMGEEPLRDFAVSSPPIVHGPGAGTRATITTKRWSLILAPLEASSAVEREFTMMVDGRRRALRPFGGIDSELYDLAVDLRQGSNVLHDNLNVARGLHELFIAWLKGLGTKEECVAPWLKCRGLR
jgi:arylsulfatase A-like enzyme